MILYKTTRPAQGDTEEVLFRKLNQLLGGQVSPTDTEPESLRKIVERLSDAQAEAELGVDIGDSQYVLARKLLQLVGTIT